LDVDAADVDEWTESFDLGDFDRRVRRASERERRVRDEAMRKDSERVKLKAVISIYKT
jgi:hypothetical protein